MVATDPGIEQAACLLPGRGGRSDDGLGHRACGSRASPHERRRPHRTVRARSRSRASAVVGRRRPAVDAPRRDRSRSARPRHRVRRARPTTPASQSAQRLSGSMTAPPPVAITAPGTCDAWRTSAGLDLPEPRLAVTFDDRAGRSCRVRADLRVEVDERAGRAARRPRARRCSCRCRTGPRGRWRQASTSSPTLSPKRRPHGVDGRRHAQPQLQAPPRLAQEHARHRPARAHPRRAPHARGVSGSVGRPGRTPPGPAAGASGRDR